MNKDTALTSCRFLGKHSLAVAWIAVIWLAGGAVIPGTEQASAAGTDDFYLYDAGLPAAPGTLLRTEPLPTDLGLQDAGRQLRILYTATDGVSGQGVMATSGAVFIPKGQVPAQGWPIVAWAHGTVGIADRCAPSRNRRTERDAKYLNAWLREGFVVVATDYERLGIGGPHLYFQARAEAFAVLDSVRAVLGGMPDLSNRIIVVGQSQGGHAAFATAGYAPSYAPELNVRGTVATGTPYIGRNNPPVIPPDQVNPTLAYLMYFVRTAEVLDDNFKDADFFTPRALPVYGQSDTLCVAPLEAAVVEAGLTRANALVPGNFAKAAAQLAKNFVYPTLHLTQPLFMGTGERDIDVSAEQQIALANDACGAGTRVVQRVYPNQDHSGTVNASLVDSIPFVRQVLADEPIATTCANPAK
jgi:pimeloyl-ACP methyl ester carboxylesterase